MRLPTGLLSMCLLVVGLAACGGGEDRTKAQLRLVNASTGFAALDLFVDDTRLQSDVAYGATDRYVEVDPDETATEITRAGSSATLASTRPSLNEGDRYTLVAYGGEGSLRTALLDDNANDPDSGKARVRVLNGTADADTLDVYLTAENIDLIDAEPLQAGAEVGTVGGLITVDAGTWRLRVTAAGDRDDLRLDISGIVLGSRQKASFVITSGAGGVLVNALLMTQRGSIEPLTGAQARVRTVAAVTDSGAVAATANGVTLMNGTGAPAVGRYSLVPAGAVVATAAVNGQSVTVPATTLTAGTDHTLMVWGPADAATASWIEDDNRSPTVAGRAKLRLVHGVAGLAAPLALTVDFSPVAAGVVGGSASLPTLLDASTTATFTVTAPGNTVPLYSDVDQTLVAGNVYTLFVVGASTSPTGILRKDR
jgi:hypothetical protein